MLNTAVATGPEIMDLDQLIAQATDAIERYCDRKLLKAQRAPGAACRHCGQSGPSKPGSKPCRHCGRNTVHK